MDISALDRQVIEKLQSFAKEAGLDIGGGKVRRTSSRFCLGVEHGDYNGTELFGVGTDRFIWFGYLPNKTKKVRLFSGNFSDEGVIEFTLGQVPEPKSKEIAHSWGRFAFGVDYILSREGITLDQGIDGVIYGNIPGGGMSRSASLTLNLILSLLNANNIEVEDKFKIVDMSQAVENDYIGSPCGKLDQIMILFAREGMGTHYNPKDNSIDYVKLGESGKDFRLVGLDTGTMRPGLEKSTYKLRRAECEDFVRVLQGEGYQIEYLADIREKKDYEKIVQRFSGQYKDYCDRLKYIFEAQQRFYQMLDAWRAGDIETVGRLFRADGVGLRDDYKISGPELEAMCDIARTVPGVLGERMLGGGDKGAAGAIVRAGSVEKLKKAVNAQYPKMCPGYADKYAIHVCWIVDGIKEIMLDA